MKLKILSYNLHKGYNWTGRRHVLSAMKKVIHDLHSDIVFFQELRGEMLGEEPQLEYLADTLWKNYSYGKNAVYPNGHHGNAILSKYPIVRSENIDLSTNRFEKRSLLHVVVDLKNSPRAKESKTGSPQTLHLFCTHLNLLEKSRLLQCEQILEIIDERCPASEPLILAGDFNDWSKKAHAMISAHGLREAFESCNDVCAPSFPSIAPALSLDRVYMRNIEAVSAHTPYITLSDHLPLCCEVKVSTKT